MSPLEAMHRVLAVADTHMKLTRTMGELGEMSPQQIEEISDIEVAISVVNAMLNTALPIARWRLFVEVKPLGKQKIEYTVCSPHIENIYRSILYWRENLREVYITLWEQRADGASMVSGYQGKSKGDRFKKWHNSILDLDFDVEPSKAIQSPASDSLDGSPSS